MTQETEPEKTADWKKFLTKHWMMTATFIVAGILVFIGAIYVFMWFAGQAQTSGLVPSSLGLWSMANTIIFMLHALFWELLLIGIPTAVGAILAWQWWNRLPQEEKKEYKFTGTHSRSKGAGGAISPLMFIAFAIKVYVDGNWNLPIATYSLNYVINSLVTILIWIAAIFAVPAAIGLTWWLRHEMNKKPQLFST